MSSCFARQMGVAKPTGGHLCPAIQTKLRLGNKAQLRRATIEIPARRPSTKTIAPSADVQGTLRCRDGESASRCRLLGSTEVWAGKDPASLARLRSRNALASLLLDAEQVVSVERLIDLLWEQTPPRTAVTVPEEAVLPHGACAGRERVAGHAGGICQSRSWVRRPAMSLRPFFKLSSHWGSSSAPIGLRWKRPSGAATVPVVLSCRSVSAISSSSVAAVLVRSVTSESLGEVGLSCWRRGQQVKAVVRFESILPVVRK
jgi:hypothetical protein